MIIFLEILIVLWILGMLSCVAGEFLKCDGLCLAGVVMFYSVAVALGVEVLIYSILLYRIT